jgi:hypothetical protein
MLQKMKKWKGVKGSIGAPWKKHYFSKTGLFPTGLLNEVTLEVCLSLAFQEERARKGQNVLRQVEGRRSPERQIWRKITV